MSSVNVNTPPDLPHMQSNEGIEQEADKLIKKMEKKAEQNKTVQKSTMSALMDSPEDAKDELLMKAYQQNESLQHASKDNGLKRRLNDEMMKMFSSKKPVSDSVNISDSAVEFMMDSNQEDERSLKKTARTNLVKEAKDAKEIQKTQAFVTKDQSVKKETLKQFSAAYSQYAFEDSDKNKEHLKKTRETLKKQGLSQKQIFTMESTMGEVMKQHMMSDLKSGLLRDYFNRYESSGGTSDEKAQEKLEKTSSKLHNYRLSQNLQSLERTGVLKTSIGSVLEKVGAELQFEMEGFIFDEMAHNITKVSLGQLSGQEYIEQLQKLSQAAYGAGIALDQEKVTERINQTIDDYGLAHFIAPNSQSGSEQGQSDEQPKQTLYVNQQELFEDKLRHLFLQQLLQSNIKELITLRFEIRKMKNGLIKLGVFSDEKELQLQREASLLAQIQFKEKLEDGFREQATLESLSGPAYRLIKSNRSFYLKRMRQCDIHLTKKDLDIIRDNQNFEMGLYINDQIRQLELKQEIKHSRVAEKKLQSFKCVLDRLRTETMILNHYILSGVRTRPEQICGDMA